MSCVRDKKNLKKKFVPGFNFDIFFIVFEETNQMPISEDRGRTAHL